MENERIEQIKGETTQFVTRRRLKVGPLIVIIMIVLLLVSCSVALFSYFRFVNDPAKIFSKAINNIYDVFHASIEDSIETETTYFNFDEISESIEADVKLDGSYMNFNKLKDNTFNINYGIDVKNDLFTFGAKVLENEKNILDGTMYFKGKKAYFESEALYNNIYSTDIEENLFESIDIDKIQEEFNANSYSIKDLDDTVRELKDALIKYLDKDSMKITKEKIEINGNKINVNKISYHFTKDSAKKLGFTFSEILLEKDDVLSNLSKILELDKEELKKTLKEMQTDDFYKDFNDDDNTDFIIYTTGITYKFVKAEIVDNQAKLELINDKDNIKISFTDFEKSDIYEINLKTKNEIVTITTTYNKEQIFKVVIKELSDNKVKLEYEMNTNGNKVKGYLIIELKSFSDTEAIGNFEFYCDLASSVESYDVKVNAEFKIMVGTRLEATKLDKAIDMKEIKEEDTKKMEKTLKDIEESNFYKYLLDLLGLATPTTPQNPTM